MSFHRGVTNKKNVNSSKELRYQHPKKPCEEVQNSLFSAEIGCSAVANNI